MPRWAPDPGGIFDPRPFYDEEELDDACERAVEEVLRARHGKVRYPVLTEDLHVLIEREGADLDVYAELSGHGADVEGVTLFRADRPPVVRISAALSTDPARVNRYRTTLTHEFGHVRFHGPLYAQAFETGRLDPRAPASSQVLERRDDPYDRSAVDWMEWQAGYVCGAALMPARALRSFLRERLLAPDLYDTPRIGSQPGRAAIKAVTSNFWVSSAAARVRLLQLKIFSDE